MSTSLGCQHLISKVSHVPLWEFSWDQALAMCIVQNWSVTLEQCKDFVSHLQIQPDLYPVAIFLLWGRMRLYSGALRHVGVSCQFGNERGLKHAISIQSPVQSSLVIQENK